MKDSDISSEDSHNDPCCQTANQMPRCPICLNGVCNVLFTHPVFGTAKIYQCTQCSHHYVYPEPAQNELNSYYDDEYSRERTKCFGTVYYDLMKRRARAQYAFIQRGLRDKQCLTGRMLDLGCGVGALTVEFEQHGFHALGIDGDAHCVEIGRKVFGGEIVCGTGLPSDPSGWDIIAMSHVLEHYGELQHGLEVIMKSISKGGFLFIEVPNCPPRIVQPGFDPEPHLHYFNERSLSQLFAGMPVEVVALCSCGPRHCKNLYDSMMAMLLRRVLKPIELWSKRKTKHEITFTEYDGHWTRYHKDAEGVWLRCLLRVL